MKGGRTAELVVRAADMSRELGVERFMGIAAIDPETGEMADDLPGVDRRTRDPSLRTAATSSTRASARIFRRR